MVRIFLVEDHTIVLEGLRTLLAGEPDVQVVGEACSPNGVVERLRIVQPDVLITDMMLGGVDAQDLIREAREALPGLRIVVLSMHTSLATVALAFVNGASAYLQKGISYTDLLDAVCRTVKDEQVLGMPIDADALDTEIRRLRAGPLQAQRQLTPREREVIQFAAAGHKNPEIARQLCISARTVETHRDNAMRKLGLKNLSELVQYALQNGILKAE